MIDREVDNCDSLEVSSHLPFTSTSIFENIYKRMKQMYQYIRLLKQ